MHTFGNIVRCIATELAIYSSRQTEMYLVVATYYNTSLTEFKREQKIGSNENISDIKNAH